MIKFIKKFYNDKKYTIEFIFYFIIALICFQFNTVEGIEATVTQGFSILIGFGLVALSYMDDRNKEQDK